MHTTKLDPLNAQRIDNPVIVIGAGANGLAVAHALRKRKIPLTIIDKALNAGDTWHHRHPQLQLNTHRDLSQLPGMAFPAGTAAFPSRDDIIRYLAEYAMQLDVPIDFGVSVTAIKQSGSIWSIETDAGVYRARHVVIATGFDRIAHIPDWEGRDTFPGELVHSADFGDIEYYRGKRVLVVGCGNSGSDILNHLSGIETERLWVSVRHGPVVFPKRLYGIPVQRLSPLLAKLPVRLVDALLSLTESLAFGNLRKWGMPQPLKGGASRLVDDGIAPAIDDGFIKALKAGRIEVVTEIQQLRRSGVELIDGRCVEADVVIAATGYRTGLEDLLGNSDALDRCATPVIHGAQQLASCAGLWFIGMRPRLPGFFHMAGKTSTEIATAIAAYEIDQVASAGRGTAVDTATT